MKFKILSLSILLFAFSGCGPTGTKLDDLVAPRKACSLDMTLENQGTQPLSMIATVSESTHEADCLAPQYAQATKTVASGQKDSLHVELMCRQCMVDKLYAVSKSDAKSTVLYNETQGSPNVFCSDSACLGR